MAYGLKYVAGWHSKNRQGYLFIDQENYVPLSANVLLNDDGSPILNDDGEYIYTADDSGDEISVALPLKLRHDSIEITHSFNDWNSPIIGLTASFEIQNDKTDFYELLPLLSGTEREYRIRIVDITDSPEVSLFEGFLNCDVADQKMLHYQSIQFTASSYLSKLEHLNATCIDTLQNIVFIDVIDEILASTGQSFNIRINCSLFPDGDSLAAGQTLFNKTGFFTELFWEDNVERKNSLEILTSILTAFDCYLYWYDGYWYIERYEDIWSEDIDYVEYQTAFGGYEDSDTEDIFNLLQTPSDLHDLTFTNQSQLLSIIPGYRSVKVNLQDKRLFNLTLNDFTNAGDVTLAPAYPDYRSWLKWATGYTWGDLGVPYMNITNAIKREAFSTEINYIGLYTHFKVTITADTQLNVKFKYATTVDQLEEPAIGPFTGDMSDYLFTFHWLLRVGGLLFFVTEDSAGDWTHFPGTEAGSIQNIEVDGSEFDVNNMSCDVEFTVPLGSVTGSAWDDATGQDFVLYLAAESYIHKDYPLIINRADTAWYGDVIITTTGDLQENVIEGTISTNFLNKKEISVDLFDMETVNYKNGVLWGNSLINRTTGWTTDDITVLTLIERLIKNKFQLYNKCRQKITSDIFQIDLLKPLQLFTDSKQSDKPFVLMGYSYFPGSDRYKINLYEYDNTTSINIV